MFALSNLPQPVLRYGVGLWRRRWVVVAVAWAAALAGWLAVWLIPDQYESRAQVFVQTENTLDDVVDDLAARPDYEQRVSVMQQALLTRPNVEEIIYRAGLDKTIEASSPLEQRVKLEGMIDWVAGQIKIDSPQPLYFEIRYAHGDPKIARDVVDAVLDLFIEQDLGASLQENQEFKNKLDSLIAARERRLAAKDQEVARFRRENAEELAIVEGNQRRRDQLEANLSRVGDELAAAKLRVTTLQTLLATTPRTTTGDQLDAMRVQLAELRSQYEETFPDIQALKARIAEMEASGVGVLPDNPEFRRTQNELRAARDQVSALETRETKLSAELEALAFTIAAAPEVQAELQRIIRDYEQTQKSYELLVQSRDRLDLTTELGPGSQGVNYDVREYPRRAYKPVSPPRALLIVASVLAAFGVGAGAALLFTALDKTYGQTSELQSAFGLPVLGAISEAASAPVKRARLFDLARLTGACVALFALGVFYVYWDVMRLPSGIELEAASYEPAGHALANNRAIAPAARDPESGAASWD